MTLLGLWYIYTSLRLDVGRVPEWGAKWAANLRARMRAGFGDERREIHSTHSLQGKLAVFTVLLFAIGWSVLSWDLSMGLSLHFQSTLYSWWFFMGALALRAHAVRAARAWRGTRASARRDGLIQRSPLPRHRKALLRVHRVLGLSDVRPVPRDLVRQHGRRDVLHAPPADPAVEVGDGRRRWSSCSSRRSSVCSRARRRSTRRRSRCSRCASLVGMWLMRYIEVYPSGYGVVPRSAVRHLGDRRVCCLYRRRVGLVLHAVHGRLPAHARDADDVAAIATKCRCRWIRRRWSRCRRTSSAGCLQRVTRSSARSIRSSRPSFLHRARVSRGFLSAAKHDRRRNAANVERHRRSAASDRCRAWRRARLPCRSRASSSTNGAIILHGPHQSA